MAFDQKKSASFTKHATAGVRRIAGVIPGSAAGKANLATRDDGLGISVPRKRLGASSGARSAAHFPVAYFLSGLAFFGPWIFGCNREANEGAQQQRSALNGVCGDGDWDLATEECDTDVATEACAADCTVRSLIAGEASPVAWRTFAGTRHPVTASALGAAVTFAQLDAPTDPEDEEAVQSLPPSLWVSLFDQYGKRLGENALPGDFLATQIAAPAVAALGEHRYVVASGVLGGDTDESGIALHAARWATDHVEVSAFRLANQTESFAQSDPDVIWTGDELVVAWVDHSDANTGPDLRYRKFDENLDPLTDELPLADEVGSEGQVSLVRFGSGWAAAWRASTGTGQEVLRIAAPDLGLSWETSPYSPPDSQERPALVDLGSGRLLAVFTQQTQGMTDDVPNTAVLRSVLLREANVGVVTWCALPVASPAQGTSIFFDASLSQRQPALGRLGTTARLLWQSEGIVGNGLAQELWQRSISWTSGTTDCQGLTLGIPEPLSDGATERDNDQRQPNIASVGGTAILGWEDYGSAFARQKAAGTPDILIRIFPVDTICTVEEPCGYGEGHCETDPQCQTDLKCGYHNGGSFGKRSTLNACIPCGNGVLDVGEECDKAIQTTVCNANCTLPFCGDGQVNDSDEQCDPGLPDTNTTTCNANCTQSSCGDAYVNPVAGEACEPPTANQNGAACDGDCTLPVCGDGIINTPAGEVCETSNPNCTQNCHVLVNPPTCAGGICPTLDSKPQGTTNDGEIHVFVRINNPSTTATLNLNNLKMRYWFVDSTAQPWQLSLYWNTAYAVEQSMQVVNLATAVPGANKYVDIPLEGSIPPGGSASYLDLSFHHTGWQTMNDSDDYSYMAGSNWVSNNKITLYNGQSLVWGTQPTGVPLCGNSVVESGEACDTGGQHSTCDADCSAVVCGDGTVNTAAGEVCDPGNNPACLSNCSGFTCTDPATCLHVKYHRYSDDTSSNNFIKVVAYVVNNGTQAVNLNQLVLRYWFTNEMTGTFQSACDWTALAGGCSVIRHNAGTAAVSPAKTGANMRWDVGFQSAGTLNPGQTTGMIQVRANSSTWNNLNDTNDYSYQNITTPAVTTKIAAYLNGVRIWGSEPQ